MVEARRETSNSSVTEPRYITDIIYFADKEEDGEVEVGRWRERERYPARSEATSDVKYFTSGLEVRKERGRDSRTLRYGKGIAEG